MGTVSQFWKTLNAYLNRLRSRSRSVERWGHFDSIVPSLVYILTKQHGVCGGKHYLKTPFNAIFETLNFEMSLDALALKNLFLSCEFQIHPLFIISPLLDNPARWVGFCINLLALPTFIYLQHSKKKQQQKKMTNAHFGGGIGQLGIDWAIMIYWHPQPFATYYNAYSI